MNVRWHIVLMGAGVVRWEYGEGVEGGEESLVTVCVCQLGRRGGRLLFCTYVYLLVDVEGRWLLAVVICVGGLSVSVRKKEGREERERG